MNEPSQFDGGNERLLPDAGRIRLVRLLACEDLPADPNHLVGKGDHRDLPVAADLDLAQPHAECGLIALQVQKRGLRTLNQKLSEVRVAPFADASQGGLAPPW